MPVYKSQTFFRLNQQGWVESWYFTQSDFTSAAVTAAQISSALLGPRDNDVVIDGVRVLQVDPALPRAGLNFAGGGNGGRSPGIASIEGPDLVAASALMRIRFVDGSKRVNLVRGLLDEDVLRHPANGSANPTPGLIQALNILGGKLKQYGVQLRRQSVVPPDTPVTKVALHPTNPSLTQLTGPGTGLGYVAGDKVKFKGVPLKQLPWLKGIWNIRESDATTISIGYPFNLAAPVFPPKMATVKILWVYVLFDEWTFADFRDRKTGRPITLTHGRSRGIPFRR